MTRDNFLFALVGLLMGFITGYLMHEVMAERQPARRLAVETAAGVMPPGVMPPDAQPAAPGTDGGAAAGGPMMEEVRLLSERVKNDPKDAEAVLGLATMNFQIRNWPRAAELFGQYLELKPDDPAVMTDLAVCYKESGAPEKALDTLRRVQKLAPGEWPSVYNEVAVLLDMRRQPEAEEALGRLRKLAPANDPRVEQLASEVERRKAR